MCGVAGILALGDRLVRGDDLEAMTWALRHRGPDGQGTRIMGPVGLGHRRLAILDLSDAGGQPMPYADERFWIVHNGEIYNFIEIRRELEGLGHRFRSSSDTEVVVAAYAEWGEECLARFNGMWAFAIWDAGHQTLFLARDRFGVKPLYYFASGGFLAFASEMKAFLPLSFCSGDLDEEAVATALDNPSAFEGSVGSLLKGVVRLGPGSWLKAAPGRDHRVGRWWSLAERLVTVPETFEEQTERFRDLFFDACRLRMRSDVPIATSLSGGLDSSSVLSALVQVARGQGAGERLSPDWQKAFVATYPGTGHEESGYARAVLEKLGIPGVFIEVDPVSALGHLDEFVVQTEQTVNPHLGAWLLYRRMRREGVSVSIDGHGGDEILVGYAHQVSDALRRILDCGADLRAAVELRAVLRGMAEGRARRPTLADSARVAALWARRRLAGSRDELKKTAFAGASDHHGINSASPFLTVRPAAQEAVSKSGVDEIARALGPVHAALYRDFHFQTLPGILRSYDLYSMASGVEVRAPFLDWRVVTYCFSVPPRSLVGGGFTKRLLRSAMKSLLPGEVQTRVEKVPFKSPLADWSRRELREFVLDSVRSAVFRQSTFWDGPRLGRAIEARAGVWEARELSIIWRFILMARFMTVFRRPSQTVTKRGAVS